MVFGRGHCSVALHYGAIWCDASLQTTHSHIWLWPHNLLAELPDTTHLHLAQHGRWWTDLRTAKQYYTSFQTFTLSTFITSLTVDIFLMGIKHLMVLVPCFTCSQLAFWPLHQQLTCPVAITVVWHQYTALHSALYCGTNLLECTVILIFWAVLSYVILVSC